MSKVLVILFEKGEQLTCVCVLERFSLFLSSSSPFSTNKSSFKDSIRQMENSHIFPVFCTWGSDGRDPADNAEAARAGLSKRKQLFMQSHAAPLRTVINSHRHREQCKSGPASG